MFFFQHFTELLFLVSAVLGTVLKAEFLTTQVGKVMHSLTILTRSQIFDLCEC